MRIAGLVLAAGKSSRMGRDKLSLPLCPHPDGASAGQVDLPNYPQENDGDHTAFAAGDRVQEHTEQEQTAEGRRSVSDQSISVGSSVLSVIHSEGQLSPIVIVHAPHSSEAWQREVQQWCRTDGWSAAECAEAERGMSYSIRCGMQQIRQSAADAVMILLADQPLIDARMLADMMKSWQQAGEVLDYIAASDGQQAQPPVILARRIWNRLDELSGDQGARKLLRQPDLRGQTLQYAAHHFWDTDTPEALQHIRDHIKHSLNAE
ncbi:nucleotidyltransferase family protein [Paenibacillus sp. Z6-24]